MARNAAVRLTLEQGQFLSEIKRTGDQVDAAARKGQKSMDVFAGRAEAAKRSMMGLGGAVRSTLTAALGLGGAFTLGAGLKNAIGMQRTYRQIAFGVKDAKGQMLQAIDVQRLAERSAAATGQKNADMAQSFRAVLDATGDLEFAQASIAAVGTTSTATGDSLEVIGGIAEQLHTKFGISAARMQDALAQVYGAARNGGTPLGELAGVAGNVGAELIAAGLNGERGLGFMLGALAATKDEMKDIGARTEGIKGLFRVLGTESALKGLGDKIGLSPKALSKLDGLARLRAILGKTGGAAALRNQVPAGEQRQALDILFVKPFEDALERAKGAGLKGQQATDAALAALDDRINGFGKATMTGAQVITQANRERQTPEAQLTAALNRLEQAFSKPEVITAIDDLAKHLPALAGIVADVIGQFAQHPIAGTAIAGGLKVGGDVLTEAAGGAISAGLGMLVKKWFGKKAVQGLVTTAGEGLVGAAGAGTAAASAGAGGAAAAFTGAELTAAGLPAMGAGGAAALTAGAIGAALLPGAALGYGLNRSYNNDDDAMKELAGATAAASGGGSLENRKAALARLDAARKAAKERNVGGGFFDVMFRGLTGVDNQGLAMEQMGDADAARTQLAKRISLMQSRQRGGNPESTPGQARIPEVTITGRPPPVSLDDKASGLIAAATKTALGGMVLTVRLASGGGGNGSRGPMGTKDPQPGGGV